MSENEKEKKVTMVLVAIILILLIVLIVVARNFSVQEKEKQELYNNSLNAEQQTGLDEQEEFERNIAVVPTMQDEISSNSAWCPTFQLVWNDMQDNLVGGNVKFKEKIVMVDNLNKQAFKEKDISEEYYYKNFGMMSQTLKEEIEQGIEEKFAEKSDILDMFEWPSEPSPDKYFFYSMLKREFEFEKEFKILDNKNFAQTENVEYFGVDSATSEEVRNQVSVLYYTSEDEFAVNLQTKQGDEVTIVRAPTGKNFEEILENVETKESKYKGSKILEETDTLSIPNLDIKALKEYTELENKEFTLKTKETAFIEKAIQTINFKLNNKGGEIKSEAGMSVVKSAMISQEPRNFDCDDSFAIFLTEKDKKLPYFAAVIDDINLFK